MNTLKLSLLVLISFNLGCATGRYHWVVSEHVQKTQAQADMDTADCYQFVTSRAITQCMYDKGYAWTDED